MTCILAAALVAAVPPIKGRPNDFIGAVGKFTLAADIHPARFRLDESTTLILKLDGDGDLSQVRTPDLSRSKAFAGRFDVVGPARRTVEKNGVHFSYPIRARSVDVKAVPSIRLSIYDDSPPRPQYRLLRTAEIPIEVLPASASESATPPETEAPAAGLTFGSWTPIVVVAAVIVVVTVLLRSSRTNRRNESRSASATKRRRGEPLVTPAVFVRSEHERWIDELAEALSLPPGRRTSAEIIAGAKRIGLEEKLVEELERNLKALDATRFGRATATVNNGDLRAIHSEIQRLVSENKERSPAARG